MRPPSQQMMLAQRFRPQAICIVFTKPWVCARCQWSSNAARLRAKSRKRLCTLCCVKQPACLIGRWPVSHLNTCQQSVNQHPVDGPSDRLGVTARHWQARVSLPVSLPTRLWPLASIRPRLGGLRTGPGPARDPPGPATQSSGCPTSHFKKFNLKGVVPS